MIGLVRGTTIPFFSFFFSFGETDNTTTTTTQDQRHWKQNPFDANPSTSLSLFCLTLHIWTGTGVRYSGINYSSLWCDQHRHTLSISCHLLDLENLPGSLVCRAQSTPPPPYSSLSYRSPACVFFCGDELFVFLLLLDGYLTVPFLVSLFLVPGRITSTTSLPPFASLCGEFLHLCSLFSSSPLPP